MQPCYSAFSSMYLIASPTVPIFSAWSSGIEMPNSFSNSMINSTVSRESAPRSSMKEAEGTTLSASTPNCSTMMSLTFWRIHTRTLVFLSLFSFWIFLLSSFNFMLVRAIFCFSSFPAAASIAVLWHDHQPNPSRGCSHGHQCRRWLGNRRQRPRAARVYQQPPDW